jgi:hypothetical protein
MLGSLQDLSRSSDSCGRAGQAPEWYLNQSIQIACDGEFKIMSVTRRVRSCKQSPEYGQTPLSRF